MSAVRSSDIALAYARTASRAVVPRRRSPVRRAAGIVVAVAVGFAGTVALAVTVPTLAGFETLTVLSGSMSPTLHAGDVIVDSKIKPIDARVGDVVTFRSPERDGKVITHRVVAMRATGSVVYFETKGDANTGSEKWSIPMDGTLGRVEYHVPKLGYVTSFVGSPFGRFAFLVIPALLFGLIELKRIWRPADEKAARTARS